MKLLNNKDDFSKYKDYLEGFYGSLAVHFGSPNKYPCKAYFNFDDQAGSDGCFNYEFIYPKEFTCECGKTHLEWDI